MYACLALPLACDWLVYLFRRSPVVIVQVCDRFGSLGNRRFSQIIFKVFGVPTAPWGDPHLQDKTYLAFYLSRRHVESRDSAWLTSHWALLDPLEAETRFWFWRQLICRRRTSFPQIGLVPSGSSDSIWCPFSCFRCPHLDRLYTLLAPRYCFSVSPPKKQVVINY
jgi:hypothetical protein